MRCVAVCRHHGCVITWCSLLQRVGITGPLWFAVSRHEFAVSRHDKHEGAALIAFVSRRTLMPMSHHKCPAPVSKEASQYACRNKRILQTLEIRSLYIHMLTCCLIHMWARRMRHQGGPLTSHVRGVPWSPHDTALICVKWSIHMFKMRHSYVWHETFICVTWRIKTPLWQLTWKGCLAALTLQHTAKHWYTLQHTAAHCNTLQHTVAHCNTLEHSATHSHT